MSDDTESNLDGLGRLFFEVHKELPREGPGSTASTMRALDVIKPFLPESPRIVDVGCGPGAQTLVLATELPHARITAIDLCEPFLVQLRDRAKERQIGDRIDAIRADMGEWSPILSGKVEPVDLVWCEGAAYFIGIANALRRWSDWLKPGGFVAFTEAVWLTDAPSPRTLAIWEEYPELADPAACLALTEQCGYEVLGSFVLPQSDWLDDYYAPMQRRIDHLRTEYADDADAMRELDVHQEEIDVCREYGTEYGYLFVIARTTQRSAPGTE